MATVLDSVYGLSGTDSTTKKYLTQGLVGWDSCFPPDEYLCGASLQILCISMLRGITLARKLRVNKKGKRDSDGAPL